MIHFCCLFGLYFSLCLMLKLFCFNVQVIDYYAKKGNVVNLPAEKPPQAVTAEVKKALS